MSNQTNPNRGNFSQLATQAVQTLQTQALNLKPNAKVPELHIKNGKEKKVTKHRLVGERYLVGRSSSSCDIVVRNQLVSQVHLSLNRDQSGNYSIQDENSLNGIYLGKQKHASLKLRHGDKITLGPPSIKDVVEMTYHHPPPAIIRRLSYLAYGVGMIMILLAVVIGIEWTKFSVSPLPNGVQGPVVVYPRDEQTPLNPQRTTPHQKFDRLSEYSAYLPDAVVASEDSRFYWHFGIDPCGIVRALFVNLMASDIRQGASTITQQLARSLYPDYVGRENTIGRKLREMVVALKLETFYSKNSLLLAYLNRVFLGWDNYGFEDAAQFYFDTSARDLTLSQAATLVAMLPAPNSYNPIRNYDLTVQLRDRVINRMLALDMISAQKAERARRSRIEVSPQAREQLSEIRAPYFYNHVLQELKQLLGSELAAEGNFIIETALDLNLQNQAERALREHVNHQGQSLGYNQGAMVSLDSETGAILSLVGGVNYQTSQYNRVTQAQRQPGSTFKVFAYAAALKQGISPHRTYSCDPITWQGKSYQGCQRSRGEISLARGLAQSENAVALRLARDVGLNAVVNTAKQLGVNSSLKAVPGLVLGQSEVTLLELTGAYAVFDNNGIKNRPHAIERIYDGQDCTNPNDYQTCRVIYDYDNDSQRDRAVISSHVTQTMTQWLQRVVQQGTGQTAQMGRVAAGKTGTTDKAVDLWFMGYLPNENVTTGVWLGNDDASPTQGSSAQAAQLWKSYMQHLP